MKKTKIILAVILCILLINIIWLIVLLTHKTPEGEVTAIKSPASQTYNQTKNLKIKNPADILDMDLGDISSSKVLSYTQEYITKFLPEIYNEINANTVFNDEYFKENSSTINKYSNIKELSDFTKLVEKMKESNINFNNYESVEFVNSSSNNNSVTIRCSIYYEGVDKDIELVLNYLNGKIQSTSLII